MLMFSHPQLTGIYHYTAMGLGCQNYIVEWSSWGQNIASIALAKNLGFKQFLSEHEFLVS